MSVLSEIVKVINIAKQIHDDVRAVQRFKEKSTTLAENIELLVQPLKELEKRCTEEELEKYRHTSGKGSGSGDAADSNVDDKGEPVWISSLLELQSCMVDAQAFLKKLSNKHVVMKFFEKREIDDNFDSLYNRLGSLRQGLILSLQMEFSSYFTDDMVNQWKANFSALDLIQKDLQDLKQELKNQGENVAQLLDRESKTPAENERHINYADFSDVKKLHDGKYGPIYKAKHRCAKKMLVFKNFEDNGLSAWKELKGQCGLWMNLNFSPFIVHLYGYTIAEDGCMCFVVEYMPLGTLRSVLLDEERHPLTWEQRKKIAKDCAEGLCAIHRGQVKTMLHRAITSTRFMLDENYRAKISDNGFVKSASKISTSKLATSSEGRGCFEKDETNYLCPEETSTSFRRTIKSEVYKLGIIFYEIAARKKPFQAKEEEDGKPWEDGDKYRFIADGNTEQPPADTPKDFKDLIDQCRLQEPSERPSTQNVVCSLESMCSSAED